MKNGIRYAVIGMMLVGVAGCGGPSVSEAKSACKQLADENPHLGVMKNPFDAGVKDGNRVLVYELELLGQKVQRVCLFDGKKIRMPSIFEQSRYLD